MQDEIICYCSSVSKAAIIEAIKNGAKSLQDIRNITNACTLGKCKELNPKKKCCSADILKILNFHPLGHVNNGGYDKRNNVSK